MMNASASALFAAALAAAQASAAGAASAPAAGSSSIGSAVLSALAAGGDAAASRAALNSTLLAASGAAILSASPLTLSAPLALAWEVAADCGAAFGNRTFVCPAGAAGREVSFRCPAVIPVPTCLWWNASAADGAGGWSSSGCSFVSRSTTAVTCACDHLTSFAARFAALERGTGELIADVSPAFEPLEIRSTPAHAIVLAFLAVATAISIGTLAARDAREARR
jgi:hypothetical protein